MSQLKVRPSRGLMTGEDGLTIVELLIALTIVMVTFAALASTVIASFAAIRNNEDRVVATALANEAIEAMTTMPWAQLGLAHDDADLPFGPTDDPVFEGEQVVLLDLEPSLADGIPPHFDDSASAERDGRQYEITRWVTFVDEDGGSDLKRMIVLVAWDDGEHSIRVEGVRAPDPSDLIDLQIISMDIVSDDTGGPFIALQGPNEADPYSNTDRFVVNVIVGDAGTSSLTLSFRDRSGTLRVLTQSPPPGGEQLRVFTIDARAYQFPHGPVPFLATATGDDGQVASDVQRARFYQPLDVQEPVVTQENGTGVPNDILIDPADCQPMNDEIVRIEAVVWGMTANEAGAEGALEATWTNPGGGLEPTPPRPLGQVEPTLEGGLYGADVYNPALGFAQTFQPGSYIFEVAADRDVADFPDGHYTSIDTATVEVLVRLPDGTAAGTCEPT